MRNRRTTWILAALSALSAIALLSTPLALADDDHANRGDKDDRAKPVHVERVANRDTDDVSVHAADIRVDNVLDAITDDVTTLSNLTVDQDDPDDSFNPEKVRSISLATVESGLSSTAAAEVTTAVNANSSALQTFLNGGSAQASAIDTALSAAGVSPSSALAVFAFNDGRLVVITA